MDLTKPLRAGTAYLEIICEVRPAGGLLAVEAAGVGMSPTPPPPPGPPPTVECLQWWQASKFITAQACHALYLVQQERMQTGYFRTFKKLKAEDKTQANFPKNPNIFTKNSRFFQLKVICICGPKNNEPLSSKYVLVQITLTLYYFTFTSRLRHGIIIQFYSPVDSRHCLQIAKFSKKNWHLWQKHYASKFSDHVEKIVWT